MREESPRSPRVLAAHHPTPQQLGGAGAEDEGPPKLLTFPAAGGSNLGGGALKEDSGSRVISTPGGDFPLRELRSADSGENLAGGGGLQEGRPSAKRALGGAPVGAGGQARLLPRVSTSAADEFCAEHPTLRAAGAIWLRAAPAHRALTCVASSSRPQEDKVETFVLDSGSGAVLRMVRADDDTACSARGSSAHLHLRCCSVAS